LPEIFFAIVAVQTMPTALNTVIFPASVGKDCNLGAGMACVSNILAIVLLPLSFYLFL
jgi:predicted permease